MNHRSFLRRPPRDEAGDAGGDLGCVLACAHSDTRSNPGLDRLTGRQRQVLALIAEGRSNTAIAKQLGISDKAVVQHASHLYEHLGLPATDAHHRRVLAVLSYLNN